MTNASSGGRVGIKHYAINLFLICFLNKVGCQSTLPAYKWIKSS